ncbi:hypothetical protein [Paraburkholderia humisilvae]|uniref:Uncharacterized protein n=1 Tax=Paraburkholderia humisilvae TaxID=627669 RepID=A0A6J5F8C0_9BURK|nr:hypothetical protein [Paraburkholderia humisilvae]CAB3774754.1 hypothetical protein LMG29542_08132 [Paraburkholderia humisilvae]
MKGLRDWTLRAPGQGRAIPARASQLRLYALLRRLEARLQTCPARITGVQGVRIMRLVALLSVMPAGGYAIIMPFGVRGLRDWAQVMSGGAMPGTRQSGPVPQGRPMPRPVPAFVPGAAARMPARRPVLGVAACTLGALGCLAWLMARETGLPARDVVPVRSAPVSAAASVSRLVDTDVPASAAPQLSTARLATIPPAHAAPLQPRLHAGTHAVRHVSSARALHPSAHAALRHPHPHAGTHVTHYVSPVRAPRLPAGAPPRDPDLPGWLPDDSPAPGDDPALTGATRHAPRPGGSPPSPGDATGWASRLTQRRLTEIPDAFGP